jgi:hypothetical protein
VWPGTAQIGKHYAMGGLTPHASSAAFRTPNLGRKLHVRIINRRRMAFNRPLWHEFAAALGLQGKLRDAELLDRKFLTVVIHESQPFTETTNRLGEHALGRIDIFPCPYCTAGFLLCTYLHELLHAWVYEHQEWAYFKPWSEDFCKAGSVALYRACGGTIPADRRCTRYKISPRSGMGEECRGLIVRLQGARKTRLKDFWSFALSTEAGKPGAHVPRSGPPDRCR